jgi:acetylornithine deacetylase/succinyl-diaminopimelate desuccinylase-like protein
VILIEACEESGSYDLPFYVEHLRARLGSPSLVVCLDSGCGNYDQLWLTTSLRGMVAGDLKAEVLSEGVHSGDASGIVPSSFRILRALLARIEDAADGRILLPALHAQIPQSRVYEAEIAAKSLSDTIWTKFPVLPGMRPVSESLVELVLNRTWRPALAITGAAGLPELSNAGNVLRPETALKLSVRLPPTVDADVAAAALKSVLERDPPYGAKVSFNADKSATGWHAPPLAPWLRAAVERASQALFGKEAALMGEGGSIPFMAMLGEAFPEAQFVITGVLGPASNAHGPNEFLHIPTAKRIAAAVALILSDHAVRTAFREAA